MFVFIIICKVISVKRILISSTFTIGQKCIQANWKESMDDEELHRTITINILDFRYLKQTPNYHSIFHLYEDKEHFLLTDAMEIHFMELPKLFIKWRHKEVDPHEDRLVRWLLLLGSAEDEQLTSVLEEIAMNEDTTLKRAIEEWDRVSQDPEVILAYQAREKAILDEQSALKRAERLGKRAGMEEGKRKTAIKLLELGVDHETIAKATELSVEEIETLKKNKD